MNKKTIAGSVVFIVIVVILAAVLLFRPDLSMVKDFIGMEEQKEERVETDSPRHTTLKVYFIDSKDPKSQTSCDVTREVTRVVQATPRMADLAMRTLLEGPTQGEKNLGLTTTFDPSASVDAGTLPLSAYYLGVSITNGVATVNFKKEALEYLNSPACMQASVKTPIIQTLKQFPTVKDVQFSIDGKVFTEWDA